MFRFVHAADLHLDSPLVGLDVKEDAPREWIREAPRRALESLVRLCLEEKVDFVVLAGDIYDGDWKDYATGQFFIAQMRRLGDLPVFLIRGNHDAANKMTRNLPLPKNVHVVGDAAIETCRLERIQVAIHGRSFQDREVRENLVREYPPPIPGWFNLGMLHTSMAGSNALHDTYAPCSEEHLIAKGYDYWALGHIHQRAVVRAADPAIVFPGNLQGRHVREQGEKGAYLIDVDDNNAVSLSFRRLDVVRWEVVEHQAKCEHDAPRLLQDVAAAVVAHAEAESDRLLAVRCRIFGESAAHAMLQARRFDFAEQFRELLRNEVGDRVWLESIRFETQAPPADEEIDGGLDDALSELRAVIEEFRAEPARLSSVAESLEGLENKLPGAVRSGCDPVKPSDPAWLAGLLDRVFPLLADTGLNGGKP
jgi:exonuclease SbcD